jgi:TPR repeat protein
MCHKRHYVFRMFTMAHAKDDREAARLFKLAAEQGNAFGQNSLGIFYATGRGGLPQDDREAAHLFKLSAYKGNAFGQHSLGFFGATGRGGLSKDDREATRLFKLAADQGNADGQVSLGVMYQYGRRSVQGRRQSCAPLQARRRPGRCIRAGQSREPGTNANR